MRSSPSGPPDWLTARPYAHRGLHGAGRPENSRAAFEAAIAAGFGIELDVQLTADAEAVVFHDYALERLTGRAGRVDASTAAALTEARLANGEPVPTLGEILRLIGDRAPLLIEIKNPRAPIGRLCKAVRAALDGHGGPAAIMSFNPEAGRWFAAHAPAVPRGLVVTEEGRRGLRGRIERRLSLRRSRARFLAYDVRDLRSDLVARARARGMPVLAWTVRTAGEEALAAAHADQIIHELPRFR